MKSSNGHEPTLVGFTPAGRWRWVEATAEEIPPAEGAPLFRAEILVSLTGGQLRDIERSQMPYQELYRLIAPMVRDWNLVGEVVETTDAGETRRMAAIPPPAVSGPDAFLLVDLDIVHWLWLRIRNARYEAPDRGNSGTPAGVTAGGSDSITTEDEGTLVVG